MTSAAVGQVWPPRTAVVVGGASGMGEAIATRLTGLGTSVLVADRNAERLERWYSESTGVVHKAECDVTSDESVLALRDQAASALGDVDLVVYTPGMAVLGPPHLVSLETWEQAFDVNVLGVVRVVGAFLPPMFGRGHGQVMITGSESGYRPQSWALGVYGTTKAAVNAYAENLAVYARGHGVQISLLCPGVVESNFGESARMESVSDYAAWGTAGPNVRPISASEVATVALAGLEQGKFFIPTHSEFLSDLADRGVDIDASLWRRADAEGVSSLE